MATVTTTTTNKAFAMDVQAFIPTDVIPEALILQTATFTTEIEGDAPAVRVPFVSVDDDAGFEAEGAVIPVSVPDTREVVIHTGKIAVLAVVSREQYELTGIGNLMSDSMRRAVVKKANAAYLNQAAPTLPAVTPPPGLFNQSPTVGGTVTTNLDAVSDAILDIEAAYGNATQIIAAPDAWASLLKFKAATGSNQSLLGAGTTAAERFLFSTPVIVSAAAPAGKLLITDKSSILSTYGPLNLAVSNEAYFNSDSIGLRCTWRIGAAIADAARVIAVTVTEPV